MEGTKVKLEGESDDVLQEGGAEEYTVDVSLVKSEPFDENNHLLGPPGKDDNDERGHIVDVSLVKSEPCDEDEEPRGPVRDGDRLGQTGASVSSVSPGPVTNHMPVKDAEAERFACQWLDCYVESGETLSVASVLLYAEYFADCKHAKENVLSSTDFHRCVRSSYPHVSLERGTGGRMQFHLTGIGRRKRPHPFTGLPRETLTDVPGSSGLLAPEKMAHLPSRITSLVTPGSCPPPPPRGTQGQKSQWPLMRSHRQQTGIDGSYISNPYGSPSVVVDSLLPQVDSPLRGPPELPNSPLLVVPLSPSRPCIQWPSEVPVKRERTPSTTANTVMCYEPVSDGLQPRQLCQTPLLDSQRQTQPARQPVEYPVESGRPALYKIPPPRDLTSSKSSIPESKMKKKKHKKMKHKKRKKSKHHHNRWSERTPPAPSKMVMSGVAEKNVIPVEAIIERIENPHYVDKRRGSCTTSLQPIGGDSTLTRGLPPRMNSAVMDPPGLPISYPSNPSPSAASENVFPPSNPPPPSGTLPLGVPISMPGSAVPVESSASSGDCSLSTDAPPPPTEAPPSPRVMQSVAEPPLPPPELLYTACGNKMTVTVPNHLLTKSANQPTNAGSIASFLLQLSVVAPQKHRFVNIAPKPGDVDHQPQQGCQIPPSGAQPPPPNSPLVKYSMGSERPASSKRSGDLSSPTSTTSSIPKTKRKKHRKLKHKKRKNLWSSSGLWASAKMTHLASRISSVPKQGPQLHPPPGGTPCQESGGPPMISPTYLHGGRTGTELHLESSHGLPSVVVVDSLPPWVDSPRRGPPELPISPPLVVPRSSKVSIQGEGTPPTTAVMVMGCKPIGDGHKQREWCRIHLSDSQRPTQPACPPMEYPVRSGHPASHKIPPPRDLTSSKSSIPKSKVRKKQHKKMKHKKKKKSKHHHNLWSERTPPATWNMVVSGVVEEDMIPVEEIIERIENPHYVDEQRGGCSTGLQPSGDSTLTRDLGRGCSPVGDNESSISTNNLNPMEEAPANPSALPENANVQVLEEKEEIIVIPCDFESNSKSANDSTDHVSEPDVNSIIVRAMAGDILRNHLTAALEGKMEKEIAESISTSIKEEKGSIDNPDSLEDPKDRSRKRQLLSNCDSFVNNIPSRFGEYPGVGQATNVTIRTVANGAGGHIGKKMGAGRTISYRGHDDIRSGSFVSLPAAAMNCHSERNPYVQGTSSSVSILPMGSPLSVVNRSRVKGQASVLAPPGNQQDLRSFKELQGACPGSSHHGPTQCQPPSVNGMTVRDSDGMRTLAPSATLDDRRGRILGDPDGRLDGQARGHRLGTPSEVGHLGQLETHSQVESSEQGLREGHRPVDDHADESAFQCATSSEEGGDGKYHHMEYSGQQNYQYDKCVGAVFGRQHLQRHQMVHKPYQCDVCEKSYIHSASLKRHEMIHKGQKPYRCDICEESYTKVRNLKLHRMTHTGQKPYQCGICDESFTQVRNLKRHLMLHSGHQTPYQCDICEKSFTAKSSMKRHQIVHSGQKPYHCDICEKSFTLWQSLKLHRMIHTGEKPYQCDICEKSYTQVRNLERHQMLHSGYQAPYQCEICGKSFPSWRRLNWHQKVHLEQEPSV